MAQLPAIQYASRQGHYVITCDNNPENIGHGFADENLFLDTYAKEEIYEAVKNKSLDGVVNFISEHGLETAAFLSERLGLPGLDQKTLNVLRDKAKFRNFLRQGSFDTPGFKIAKSFSEDLDQDLNYPLIIKPVDRGGNLGITKTVSPRELYKAFETARKFSVSGEVVLEEYISGGTTINGDCLVMDGKIVAHMIGDYFYDRQVNSLLPFATAFPSRAEVSPVLDKLQRLIESTGFQNGAFNFEAIIKGDKVYFIEVNPRHSGNFIYKLMDGSMGIELPQIAVSFALGEKIPLSYFSAANGFFAYALVYTARSGIFENVKLSQRLEENLIEKYIFKKPGELLEGFKTLYDRIGLLLLKFSSRDEMEEIVSEITQFYEISLKDEQKNIRS